MPTNNDASSDRLKTLTCQISTLVDLVIDLTKDQTILLAHIKRLECKIDSITAECNECA
jgi:hypothetical protein